MSSTDIPAGMRLKEAAGWNQTEQDWANLLEIEPEGCWVWEEDGRVAGSATAVCYGRELAWIGMVLVLPEFRGRGIARELMEHALRYLDQRGVECVKLDATDMGRPLYVKLGFEDETPIERWARDGAPAAPAPVTSPKAGCRDSLQPIAALDRAAFGADRRRLLELLAASFPKDCRVAPGACLMGRPGSGAYFLGPCVAENAAVARSLIEDLLTQNAGQRVFWDLLPENRAARALAAELGFECKRRLIRMALPSEGCSRLNGRSNLDFHFATAGFEYG